jgi:hypothetical protein
MRPRRVAYAGAHNAAFISVQTNGLRDRSPDNTVVPLSALTT